VQDQYQCVAGDVRAAYRAAVLRLKQDFDRRLAEAGLNSMHKATPTAANTQPLCYQGSCTPNGGFKSHWGVAGGAAQQQCSQPGSTSTDDVTKQLNALQVKLNDEVSPICVI
jgi:hypothetical protein